MPLPQAPDCERSHLERMKVLKRTGEIRISPKSTYVFWVESLRTVEKNMSESHISRTEHLDVVLMEKCGVEHFQYRSAAVTSKKAVIWRSRNFRVKMNTFLGKISNLQQFHIAPMLAFQREQLFENLLTVTRWRATLGF